MLEENRVPSSGRRFCPLFAAVEPVQQLGQRMCGDCQRPPHGGPQGFVGPCCGAGCDRRSEQVKSWSAVHRGCIAGVMGEKWRGEIMMMMMMMEKGGVVKEGDDMRNRDSMSWRSMKDGIGYSRIEKVNKVTTLITTLPLYVHSGKNQGTTAVRPMGSAA